MMDQIPARCGVIKSDLANQVRGGGALLSVIISACIPNQLLGLLQEFKSIQIESYQIK